MGLAMMNKFQLKDRYTFDDLKEIMALLRSENGCPWDQEQDHHSVRNNFLEEVYEVLDAIDRDSSVDLCEELGDTLLQVVFHSQMSAEAGEFTIDDVCDGICKKLIHRHPHVFGDTVAKDADEVLNNWDAIKKEEKKQTTYSDTLNSVPKAFPALLRAQKVQKRAAKAGFDWPDITEPLLKVSEELAELEDAIEEGCSCQIREEFGDLLFSMVNVSRFLKLDAEEVLAAATDKFIRRFEAVEKMAVSQKIDMPHADAETLDNLWEAAKENEGI